MPELPEEAVRAAEDAYRCAHTSGVPEREIARIVAVAAVEAAAPAIAAQERADERRKIAAELRAEGERERIRLCGETGDSWSQESAIHNAITGWEMAAHFVEGGPKGTVTIINQLPERTETDA